MRIFKFLGLVLDAVWVDPFRDDSAYFNRLDMTWGDFWELSSKKWSNLWLTSNTISLANIILKENKWELCPILADALQDAGFDDENILLSLRKRWCLVEKKFPYWSWNCYSLLQRLSNANPFH